VIISAGDRHDAVGTGAMMQRVALDKMAGSLYHVRAPGRWWSVSGIGKILIISGLVMVVVGVLALAAERISWLGRLPGDLTIRRDGVMIYVPLASCLLASVVLSFLLYLFRR